MGAPPSSPILKRVPEFTREPQVRGVFQRATLTLGTCVCVWRVQHLEDVKRDVSRAASSSTVQAALATERTLYTQVESTVRDVERQLVTVMARLDAEQNVVASLRASASPKIHANVGDGGGVGQAARGADAAAAAAAPGGSNTALLNDIDRKLAQGQAQYADAVGLLRTEILSKLDRFMGVAEASPAVPAVETVVVQAEASEAEVATPTAEEAKTPAAEAAEAATAAVEEAEAATAAVEEAETPAAPTPSAEEAAEEAEPGEAVDEPPAAPAA